MKKRVVLLLIGIFFLIGMNSAFAFSGAGGGSLANPYIITNCTQLNETRNNLVANYSLGNDINMSVVGCEVFQTGVGFEPIGIWSAELSDAFTGNFNGEEFTINNLYINRPGTEFVGLFGFTIGNISDVGLINNNVTGDYAVGGLVGYSYGNISDSYSTGSVTGINDYVGGLVGDQYDTTTISNSYSTGNVNGNDYVGGLVGRFRGNISASYSTGNVNGNDYVGGLVGWSYGDISNSNSTGSVNGTSYHVGGLVGYQSGSGKTISNSYSTGSVTGIDDYVGGLVGYQSGKINNSYSTGNVNGNDYVGGLVGYQSGNINNSNSTGSVNGTNYIGGLVGYQSGNINNSYSTGSVNGTSYYVGGLVGYQETKKTISNSYSIGSVTGTSNSTGGLVGYSLGNISASYSTGNVTGNSKVGGLVGYFRGNINNSYSIGSVNGTNYIGGLIGNSRGNITNSYSIGSVNGTNYIGGLVGNSTAGGTTTASYWDINASGQTNSNGTEIGKTTIEMKTISTFNAIWNISSSLTDLNNGYPYLAWQANNNSYVWLIYVNISDTTYPTFSNYWDNNATLANSGIGLFNVTLESTNGTVFLNINGVNVTATNITENVYNASYEFTTNGTYNYKWYAYGNGSSNLLNVSETRNYVVSDIIYPVFTGLNNNSLVGSGTAVFNVTVGNTNGSVYLNYNNVNYSANNLGSGVYNISLSVTNGTFVYYWLGWGNGVNNYYNATTSRNYVVDTQVIEQQTASSNGGGSGSFINKTKVINESSCIKNSDCPKGYSCYNKNCVKLFDINIININYIPELNKVNFTYLLKPINPLDGDVLIYYKLIKENKVLSSGSEAIYINTTGAETIISSLLLPDNIKEGDYEIFLKVTYESYSASSHKTFTIPKVEEQETEIIRIVSFEKVQYTYFIIPIFLLINIILVVLLIINHRKKKETKKMVNYIKTIKEQKERIIQYRKKIDEYYWTKKITKEHYLSLINTKYNNLTLEQWEKYYNQNLEYYENKL